MRAALSRVVEHLSLSSSSIAEEIQMYYYGVHIPMECSFQEDEDGQREEVLHVYTDKEEALKVMKQSKKARFKQFTSRNEAVAFAVHGAEPSAQPKTTCVSGGEKVMPFKCPKTQEMIKFRKAIECGDVQEVRRLIWENPRYLVSSGDTPSILQEGSRYNALHVAAKAKNAEITRLILDSVTSMEFVSYLYDDNDPESCRARIDVLRDLYLNMPDKGLNETPLHLAVKHGAVDVVEHLVSYPDCQKNLPNKFKLRPKDIVCDRVTSECQAAREAITALLEEQFFIPVLRYEDNSMQPRVGEAFSPNEPLKIEKDPLSPRLEIQAYAGPMNKAEADVFKKKWKTPPHHARKRDSPSSSLRLCDAEKGLERIGRNLASEFNVPWKEYWSFLDTFVDLTSEEGLSMLEHYLKRRFEETMELVNSLEENDTEHSTGNLNNTLSPISDLCETFKTCTLNDVKVSTPDNNHQRKYRSTFSSWDTEKKENSHKRLDEGLENDGKHPLLYVERSCQVFGKRIATAIFHASSSSDVYQINTDSLKDSLESQVKHLQALVTSFCDDDRFQSVDFQLIHSRVASAVAQNFSKLITDAEKRLIISSLKEIEWNEGTLSDDEDLNYHYRCLNHELPGTVTKQQLHCLVKNLTESLSESDSINTVLSTSARTEGDCYKLWALATSCSCSWGVNQRHKGNSKRKTVKGLSGLGDCDNPSARRKVFFGDVKDIRDISPIRRIDEKSDEEPFRTPPSNSSDSEEEFEEIMEDPIEPPDTFIYSGDEPSKTDFAVLDALDRIHLSAEKYPNIYRWRHLVLLHSQFNFSCRKTASPGTCQKKKMKELRMSATDSFATPNKSLLNQSWSSGDSYRRNISTEPWERITGPYTPRRGLRPSRLSNQDSPMSR